MKKIVLILGLTWIAISAQAQQKSADAGESKVSAGNPAIQLNKKKMKDYVFILRLKAITPEIIAQVGPKWAALIPKWINQGHYAGNSVMVNEGHLITGKERSITDSPVVSNGLIILDVFRIKAVDMAQAMDLARQCPTLDAGGTVEVREVQPTPEVPVN